MTKNALEEGGFQVRLHAAKDGEEAMAFIRANCHSSDTDTNSSCPNLILMDLNLLKKSGREVLSEIRSHPDTRHIPVIILTSSAEEQDIAESDSKSANCYITKPIEVDSFVNAIKCIGEFWTEVAKLPKTSN